MSASPLAAQPLGVWAPPSAAPELLAGEIHLWRVSLEPAVAAMGDLGDLLSADERSRAERFAFARDRDRFVAARGWLRQILGAYLGATPQKLQFAYGPFGKPALAGSADGAGLCFNLAHSGDLALYALAQNRCVGIDIELLRHDLAYAALLDDVCSSDEQWIISRLPEALGRQTFYRSWVCKEAYVKARGEGLSCALTSVEVISHPDGSLALRLPTAAESTRWSLYTLDPGHRYAAAVVVEGQNIPVRLFRSGGTLHEVSNEFMR